MQRREEFIISCPANIAGIYTQSDLEIRHMNNGFDRDRNYFVIKQYNNGSSDITFGGDAAVKAIYISQSAYVEDLCTLFSVFFGKRIDFYGLLKSGESYRLPQVNNGVMKYTHLPTNRNNERIDQFIPMNRTEIEQILNLFNDNKINIFLEAGSFYKKALINIDYDVEIAYLDLIRAIEILGGNVDDEETDFEGELKEIYDKIKEDTVLATKFRRYHGSGKKFRSTILGLIGQEFRQRTESTWSQVSLPFLNENSREKALKNTYAVRSEYVHSGLNFGSHVIPEMIKNSETGIIEGFNELLNSEPVPQVKCLSYQKTLTFSGLERIVRWTLIQYLTSK